MFEELFSKRAKTMKASEIRELLKLVTNQDIISFAGGLPNPATFPTDELVDVCATVLREEGTVAVQYGTTEGVRKLREEIASRMKRTIGLDLGAENILITSGSQQALDLLGKLFLDPGDTAVIAAPTYLGAVSAFKAYDPNFITVPLDENGLQVELLEEQLKDLAKRFMLPKFVYTVPTFQNPAGVTMSEGRRDMLIDLSVEYDFIIIEDSPYEELRYAGDPIRPLVARAAERVLNLGTFSKILAPGFRTAWVVGNEELIRKVVISKQAADLCTNTFSQYVIAEYMSRGLLDPHIEEIRTLYSRKRNIMLKALDEHMPEEITWTRPDGGLFLWLTAPTYVDTKDMFPKAVKSKVAYVTGTAFYVDGRGLNEMRLNFSYTTDEDIERGIERLAGVLESEMRELDQE
ncbi:MAG TPA: PLP-dependent aminotransferase family protein [Thermoplasmata archaeon]|nr:PLP-dependent aminotransferase family protein [Thermoplasmata archaeon]